MPLLFDKFSTYKGRPTYANNRTSLLGFQWFNCKRKKRITLLLFLTGKCRQNVFTSAVLLFWFANILF